MLTIENLLNRGATFNYQSIQILTIKNNVKLAKELIPLGLDIHAVDQFGKNALYIALTSTQSRLMFDFLISHNISLKQKNINPDPLLLAINLAFNDDLGIYYAGKLISYGAPLETIHISTMNKMELSNNSNFSTLIEQHPQLKPQESYVK